MSPRREIDERIRYELHGLGDTFDDAGTWGPLPRLRHDPLPERVLVRGLTEKSWRGQAAASSGPPVPFVVGIERAALSIHRQQKTNKKKSSN